jgi:hypothetical protein
MVGVWIVGSARRLLPSAAEGVEMETPAKKRVLVVANRTAATHRLLDEVARRQKTGPWEFALLIPDVGDRKQADWTLDNALPLLRRAAGGPVEGILGGADPLTSVRDTLRDGHFDEIIVSTLPKKTSKWLRRDVVRKIEGLGLPVTTVTPTQKSLRAAVDDDDVTRGLGLAGGGGS